MGAQTGTRIRLALVRLIEKLTKRNQLYYLMCSQPVDIGYTDVMNKPRGKFVDLAQSIHAELTIHELYSLTSDILELFPYSSKGSASRVHTNAHVGL